MREAEAAYRRALALQVAGQDSAGEWGRFVRALSVALAGRGASQEWRWLDRVGWPSDDPGRVRAGVRAILDEVRGWDGGQAALGRWDDMARAIGAHERSAALPEIERRSPDFAALRAGRLPGSMSPFRAQGVTERQRKGLVRLLADSMLDNPGVSAVGKALDELGVGDFVTVAQARLGVSLTDARLETVMRTSVATAETEAENGIMEQPGVRLLAPLMEWNSIRDSRTRPTHAAMHGYANTVEAYRILRIGPPAGFNCRCFRAPMSLARCVALGLTDRAGVPQTAAIRARNGARSYLIESGLFPDPGFLGPA